MKSILPFRQGDVLIEPVAKIPDGLIPVPRENGRVILAHGEATGHAHAIVDEAELFQQRDLDEMAGRFLRVLGEHPYVFVESDERVEIDGSGVTVFNIVSEADGQVVGKSTQPPDGLRASGVLLEHDEHDVIVLPKGDHLVHRQREFAPEAIRNVAD